MRNWPASVKTLILRVPGTIGWEPFSTFPVKELHAILLKRKTNNADRCLDILSQWGLLGWKQFKPHNWVACVVFLWGMIATVQAAVTGWGGLMVCRFFLAIAEAMYGPGVPLYFSYFYPREKIGFRVGCFISGSAMANAYGGAL